MKEIIQEIVNLYYLKFFYTNLVAFVKRKKTVCCKLISDILKKNTQMNVCCITYNITTSSILTKKFNDLGIIIDIYQKSYGKKHRIYDFNKILNISNKNDIVYIPEFGQLFDYMGKTVLGQISELEKGNKIFEKLVNTIKNCEYLVCSGYSIPKHIITLIMKNRNLEEGQLIVNNKFEDWKYFPMRSPDNVLKLLKKYIENKKKCYIICNTDSIKNKVEKIVRNKNNIFFVSKRDNKIKDYDNVIVSNLNHSYLIDLSNKYFDAVFMIVLGNIGIKEISNHIHRCKHIKDRKTVLYYDK